MVLQYQDNGKLEGEGGGGEAEGGGQDPLQVEGGPVRSGQTGDQDQHRHQHRSPHLQCAPMLHRVEWSVEVTMWKMARMPAGRMRSSLPMVQRRLWSTSPGILHSSQSVETTLV